MTDLRTISYSQLQVWRDCEVKWEYSYKYGLIPKDRKRYFAKGTLVHEILSVYYQVVKSGLRPGSQEAISYVIEFLGSDLDMIAAKSVDTLTIYKEAVQACMRYMRDYSPAMDSDYHILSVEQEIQLPLVTPDGRDFLFIFIMDLLVQDAYNKIWVLDHKSTGQQQYMWTPSEAMLDGQTLSYAAAMTKLGVIVEGIIINMLCTYDYKNFMSEPLDKLYRRFHVLRSHNEMAWALENYGRAVDEQEEKIASGKPLVFKATKECSKCPYNQICTMRMKGMDPSGYIVDNFELKEGHNGRSDAKSGYES